MQLFSIKLYVCIQFFHCKVKSLKDTFLKELSGLSRPSPYSCRIQFMNKTVEESTHLEHVTHTIVYHGKVVACYSWTLASYVF